MKGSGYLFDGSRSLLRFEVHNWSNSVTVARKTLLGELTDADFSCGEERRLVKSA